MSGVFGVIDPLHRTDLPALSDRMARDMAHRDWFVTESHVDEPSGVALGRIGIGHFNQGSQPVWNADHTMALVMAGEVYDTLDLGKDFGVTSQEQAVLALYERDGEDFINQLNGFFALAILDCPRNRLLIATDRFATYNIFYAASSGRLVFAPEVKGVLCDPLLPRRPDMVALAQYIRFQHLLGSRTFFEGIQLIPPASVLTCDIATGASTLREYWSFREIDYQPGISFEDAVAESGRLLRKAIQRQTSDDLRLGIYLSGGLDSRAIAGMVDGRPIATVTYGAPGCRDVVYAEKIARAVGSSHHWFDMSSGDWVREIAGFHLELTEGFHSWIHAHGLSTLPSARQWMDVNLSGWDGGVVLSYPEAPEFQHYRAVDQPALFADLFNSYCQKQTWPGVTEAEERMLYCEPTWKEIQGQAFDSLRQEYHEFQHERPEIGAQMMYVRNHCGRLTHNFVTFYRSHVEMRLPFFDYDLFDFILSLRASLTADYKLYRALLQRELPKLARIPWDNDEYLPTTQPLIHGAQKLWIKGRNRLSRYLSAVFPTRPTLYADYEEYLRHDLRQWAEDILYDPRTEARGIFDMTFVRSLMRRHMSGQEMWTIGKIAPIMTYEMMLRRFCD